MRTSFWLLLLANVILLALIQQEWLWQAEELLGWRTSEPVVQPQPALHEEKIRLLDKSPSKPEVSSPASAPTIPAASHPFPSNLQHSLAISSSVVAGTNDTICLEWGEFSGADFKPASAALSTLQLGNKLDTRQVEQVIAYWVYIPPLVSKAAAKKKAAQLKMRGVGEYFIVQDDGPLRNAISLGVFKTQEASKIFLNELHLKNIRSARVGERAGKQKATIFILNGVGPATEARLASIQKDFPGSELKKISCAH